MAVFGLFSDARPRIQGVGEAFFFDGMVSAQHSVSTTWTSEPIENGSEVTDNRVIDPRDITITAIVSSAEASGFDRTRHVKAWLQLVSLVTAIPAQLYTVATTLEQLPNMALISASAPQDASTGQAITATIIAREKQISETTGAQNLALAAQDGGQGEVDVGTQGFEAAA